MGVIRKDLGRMYKLICKHKLHVLLCKALEQLCSCALANVVLVRSSYILYQVQLKYSPYCIFICILLHVLLPSFIFFFSCLVLSSVHLAIAFDVRQKSCSCSEGGLTAGSVSKWS